ncbi:MAG: hypothetical protein FWE77_01680 [Clostridia bacterium]|nr:hypothetical protein [Clostridia bacterium]
MPAIVKYVGIAGFVICLAIMYCTNHGIRGLRAHDADFRLLDMRFHYTAADVHETFTKLGEGGRLAYRNYWILDFFFIACFLIVMFAAVDSIAMPGWLKSALIALSIARAAFDATENGILLYLIGKYPAQNNVLATLCSWVTTCKFVALYLWMLAVAVTLLRPLIRRS